MVAIVLTLIDDADKSEAEALWAKNNRPSEWQGKL